MKDKLPLVITTLLSLGVTLMPYASAAPSEAESQLLSDIAKDGMLEVDLGKIAEKKATNADVQRFAKHMVKDHSKANDKLKVAATKDHIKLPSEISAEQQTKKSELSAFKGADFDRAYMKAMVAGHEKAVAAVEKETKIGSGAPKQWGD